MKIYDNIKLNTELEDLSERGIHKGCNGIILDMKADICFVRFRNPENTGDYACVNVNKKYLDFWMKESHEYIVNWERFKSSDKIKKDRFNPRKFYEYDLVEVTVEKEKYAKYGVHKGMQGVIMDPRCLYSEYYVIFTDKTTAEDIADIPVHEDDLILIRR